MNSSESLTPAPATTPAEKPDEITVELVCKA
ncbi:MAG: hypothetical protein ACD_39C01962G0001, partial [uncultured bacterium]